MEDLERETDLYEIRLRRESGRYWIGAGAVAVVGVLIVVVLAPGHVLFYGMFLVGAGAIAKGAQQLSGAKKLEQELEDRDEDKRRAR